MLLMKRDVDVAAEIVTTITNPYFFLWWATVGAQLTVLALIGVHESCDLSWDCAVSYSVHSSRRLWTGRVAAYVFGTCGALLLVFEIYFIVSSVFSR